MYLYVNVPLVDEFLDVERDAGPVPRRHGGRHAGLRHYAVGTRLRTRQPECKRPCVDIDLLLTLLFSPSST